MIFNIYIINFIFKSGYFINTIFFSIFIFIFMAFMDSLDSNINTNFCDIRDDITIASINVGGIKSNNFKRNNVLIDKRKLLVEWMYEYDVDICCVQEWFKSAPDNIKQLHLDESEFKKLGYGCFYNNSHTISKLHIF